jgi:nitrous oxidase accessory protein NosD
MCRYGIYFQYTTGSRILHVKALNNTSYGVAYWYSQNGMVDHVTASENTNEYGFYLYYDNHVNLTNVKAAHNDYGIYDQYSLDMLDTMTANSNAYGFYIYEPIWVGSDYYTVENSTADHNSSTGFYISANYPTAYYQGSCSTTRPTTTPPTASTPTWRQRARATTRPPTAR